jgi:HSP20 family protein
MADPHIDDGQDAAAKSRSKTPSPPDSSAKLEPRSFTETARGLENAASHAADETRDTANAGLRAGKEIASAGEDAARKAGGQAMDLWRASLDPLTNMQGEVTRWFEQAWRQSLGARLSVAPQIGQSVLAAMSGGPTADLYETADQAELVIELPGLSPKDVHLAVKGDILSVSGERIEAAVREDGAYRVHERRLGRFERTFALPSGVDTGRIDARFDKGVLTVTMPRNPALQTLAQPIPIKG